MTRGRGRLRSRPRGPAAVVLLAVLALLGGVGVGPLAIPSGDAAGTPSAPAATLPAPSVLALTAVTPPVAGPGVPVTFTGTVTASTAALVAPTVRVVVGTTPVIGRAAVTQWATGTGGVAGSEVGSATVAGPVAPGTSAPFTITVPAGRLALSRSFGAVPVAVQLSDAASNVSEVLRTFVGWQRTKQYEPLRLGIVAPVTLSPKAALFEVDATVRTAAWQAELAPDGRINRILDGTEVTGPAGPVPVTWAVDPATLGPALSTSGTTGGDPLTPIVTPLLTRLATGAGRHTIWALPDADPDLAATVESSPDDPTVAKQVLESTALGRRLGIPVTTGVAWPTDGNLEAKREAGLRVAYQGIGLTAVLGSASALPVVPGFSGQAPRRTSSGVTLLAWDDELSSLSTQTATPAAGALTSQRFLAETVALLGESPGVSRSFLVALPRTVDPDPTALRQLLGTIAQTPWVQVVPTGDLQQQAATQDSVATTSAGSWQGAGPAQVDAARLTRIEAERQVVGEVATVLGDNGLAFRAQWSTMLDQLTSVRWRADPAQLTILDQAVTQATTAATSRIAVSDQTTNFLADEGILQVTVVNDLDVPVEGLRLVLAPTNPRLRIVAQPDPVTIGANSRAVIPVQAQALAAGLVPVTGTLTTSDGTPIGAPGTITVRANPPGYSFYIVGGIVLGLILLVGIVRTVRRPGPRPLSGATSPPSDPATAPASAAPVSTDRPVG